MATKDYELPGIGLVRLYKRKGASSMRLSVTSDGHVRVTMPTWTPYRMGVEFARSKESWILEHLPKTKQILHQYDKIGKAHRLQFVAEPGRTTTTSRLSGTEIRIMHPEGQPISDPRVQKVAITAAERALRTQAEKLLPDRLASMAAQKGFTYASVDIKRLRRRWGSCTNNKEITFNYFLMQLPWQLIDYVIVHELVHTRVLHHGPEFWELFESVLPTARELRAEMRSYQPAIRPFAISAANTIEP